MPRTTKVLLAALCAALPMLAQPRFVGRLGETNIGPNRVLVHVTVAVGRGADGNAAAEEALARLGARPWAPTEYAVTGMVWDPFGPSPLATLTPIVQNYNATGAPYDAAAGIQGARDTWSNVIGSKFRFSPSLGSTTRCPSLVQECPGAQVFDGNNDIGWMKLASSNTLAVTWYSTSVDEADMAINTSFSWTGNPAETSKYHLDTVVLHELGHVVGLDHSTVEGAVMEPYYEGPRALSQDDQRGIIYIYPQPGSVGAISGVVRSSTGAVLARATVSLPGFLSGVSTMTNSLGQFTFSNVPNLGSYNVTASLSGYTSQTITNVLVPSTTVNFSLTSSGGTGGGCKGRGCK
jgi:hypothetical protein